MITKHLKKGERVKIAGLGILKVRNRAARMGRNPATGETIQIKASKKVAFRATKELKERSDRNCMSCYKGRQSAKAICSAQISSRPVLPC